MSVTTIKLSGKKDAKTGAELAWKINARHLTADKYPQGPHATIPGSKKGETVKVLQIPLLPSNVTAREFGTMEDVQSVAGADFAGWVVRAANKLSREDAEAAAKAEAASIESYTGQTLTFDGSSRNIFAAPAEKAAKEATGSVRIPKSALSQIDEISSLSDAERLAAMDAMFAEIRKAAAK